MSSYNFLRFEHFEIGINTEAYLQELVEGEGNEEQRRYVSEREIQQVCEICVEFWIESACQTRKRLPLDNALIKNLEWLQPQAVSRSIAITKQVIECAKCLPNVVQTAEIAPLKRECTENLCTSINSDSDIILDKYWTNVSVIKNPANLPRFPLLSKLAKALLIFFHSNVDSERLFLSIT